MRTLWLSAPLLLSGLALTLAARGSDGLPDFDEWWDYNDPQATEARFQAHLGVAEQSGDTGYHAEVLTQIARAQGLQRQFDDAHATLDRAERLLIPTLTRATVRCLVERGRVWRASGQPDQAKPLFLRAFELANPAGFAALAVDAAHMVATVESPDQALIWNHTALHLAEGSQEPQARKWLGSLYHTIGWSYHDRRDHEKALECFLKALDWREEQKQHDEILIARWAVARALRSLGRLNEALVMQLALEAVHQQIGSIDGYVFEEIGECLLALKRPDEAKTYFSRAYQVLAVDPWLVTHETERLNRLKSLGDVSES